MKSLGIDIGGTYCFGLCKCTNNGFLYIQKSMDYLVDENGNILPKYEYLTYFKSFFGLQLQKFRTGEVIPKTVPLRQEDFIPWKRGVSF